MKSMKDLVAEARKEVPQVSVDSAAELKDMLVLDVREPEELREGGKVPGAINIPRGVLEMRADPENDNAERKLIELRGTDRPVLVYCALGGRATLAAHTLRRMGYEARNLDGGFTAWRSAGNLTE